MSRAPTPGDQDEYKAENVFWVPPGARWIYLQNSAKQPEIGKIVDDAMVAIERDNPRLKGVLPKEYARPALDKHRLGELIDLIGTIELIPARDSAAALGSARASRAEIGALADLNSDSLLKAAEEPPREYGSTNSHRSKDILGRVYEYFLGQFASAEGKKGGQFYTPQSVVRLLVEMLAPYKGRIYDPCCGSGGMAEMGRMNDEGRNRSKRTHKAIRTADRSTVRTPAEIDRSPSTRKAATSFGNIRWRKLSRSASRAEQSGVHRKMWRFTPGARRIGLLAGTADRGRHRLCDRSATTSGRVRRVNRHLRHNHQTSERTRVKSELRMQKLLPFSFLLRTSPVLARRGIEADFGPEHADTFRRDLHPDLRA